MIERKRHDMENVNMENAHPENGRIYHYWKMIEKPHPENDRMENAHPENDRIYHHRKMIEKAHPENDRIYYHCTVGHYGMAEGHSHSNINISDKNKDNDTKFSGYDLWGLPSTSRRSWMTPGT